MSEWSFFSGDHEILPSRDPLAISFISDSERHWHGGAKRLLSRKSLPLPLTVEALRHTDDMGNAGGRNRPSTVRAKGQSWRLGRGQDSRARADEQVS
jgi:hypothetical protein